MPSTLFKKPRVFISSIILGFIVFFAYPLYAEPALPEPLKTYSLEDPPQGLFAEDWMEIRIAGQKVGYVVSRMERQQDTIHSTINTYMRIGRGAMASEVKTQELYRETLKGVPLGLQRNISMARNPIRTQGEYHDGVLSLTLESPGYIHELDVPLSSAVLFPWGLNLETYRQGLEQGTTYSLKTYLPDVRFDGPVKMDVEIGEPGSVEIGSHTYTLIQVQVDTITDERSVPSVLWVTDEGRVVKNSVTMIGLPIDMILVDKEDALADFVSTELMGPTLITLEVPLPMDAQKVIYQIYGLNARLVDALPDYGAQHVEPLDESNVLITVTGKPWISEQASSSVSLSAEEQKAALQANLFINSDDPLIITMAEEALGGESVSEGKELAAKLRDYVNQHITIKSLDVGFATASEVAREREGDCSEHAVLLAALGRVHGLPSRVVAGLVYTPEFLGRSDVLGYHLWTQFYYDGQWWDYDAALPDTEDNPYRIALLASTLDNQGMLDLGLDLAEIIGQIHVEVMRIE